MKRYIKNIEDLSQLEPIESMSRIGLDKSSNMLYYVNPDTNRVGEPYFKVYDNITHSKSTHIARISFLKPNYIIHRDEAGKQPWKLNSSEKKKMVKYLEKKSGFFKMSLFQYSMYLWNNEYGFFDEIDLNDDFENTMIAYSKGFYDFTDVADHPSYLRSDLTMPDYMLLK